MKPKEIIKMTNDFDKIRKEVMDNLTEEEWKTEAKYQLMGKSYISQKVSNLLMNTLNNRLNTNREEE